MVQDIFSYANISPTTPISALSDRLFINFEKAKGSGTEWQQIHDKMVFDGVKQALRQVVEEEELPWVKRERAQQKLHNALKGSKGTTNSNKNAELLQTVQNRVAGWMVKQNFHLDSVNAILAADQRDYEFSRQDAIEKEKNKIKREVAEAIFNDLLVDTVKAVSTTMDKKQKTKQRK